MIQQTQVWGQPGNAVVKVEHCLHTDDKENYF